MRAIEVSPGLWIRGQINIIPSQAILQLHEKNIHSLLSVSPQGDGLWSQHVIDYRHQPLSDGKNISPLIDELADWVWERVLGGVMVTCHAGRNRSGLIVAKVLMRLYTLTGEEALEVLRSKRPGAIANPAFEEYLKGLPKYDSRS
jgi:protein-tyrosine phosphatase